MSSPLTSLRRRLADLLAGPRPRPGARDGLGTSTRGADTRGADTRGADTRGAGIPSGGIPSAGTRRAGTAAYRGYPGDAAALPDMTWAGDDDGEVDPGEIVWTWVPFEEDHTQGKDRPVLVIGREGPWLIALQLTSQDHDRDAEQERRAGRLWVDIGTGPWDGRGRPSEVRVNRLLRVDPAAVRREGAVLPRSRYETVVEAVRAAHRRR